MARNTRHEAARKQLSITITDSKFFSLALAAARGTIYTPPIYHDLNRLRKRRILILIGVISHPRSLSSTEK